MNLLKCMKWFQTKGTESSWAITDPEVRILLSHFQNTNPGQIKLLQSISPDDLHKVKSDIVRKAKAVGFTSPELAAVDSMSLQDLIKLERKILKYEILTCGPQANREYLTSLPYEMRIPFVLRSEINTHVFARAALKWTVATLLGGVVFLYPALVSSVLGLPELDSAFKDAYSGMAPSLPNIGLILFILGFATMFKGIIRAERVHSTEVLQELLQVSNTWEDVFENSTPSDAFLLYEISLNGHKYSQYPFRWGDLTPKEAMVLCLQSNYSGCDSRAIFKNSALETNNETSALSQTAGSIPVPKGSTAAHEDIFVVSHDNSHISDKH